MKWLPLLPVLWALLRYCVGVSQAQILVESIPPSSESTLSPTSIPKLPTPFIFPDDEQ